MRLNLTSSTSHCRVKIVFREKNTNPNVRIRFCFHRLSLEDRNIGIDCDFARKKIFFLLTGVASLFPTCARASAVPTLLLVVVALRCSAL